ncbi:DUF805 domain-containing protein [Streptomyces sp. NPDC057486]|uniref:DUF805 domain-containing protein n=1 Tax=Streptomyces sp. NPDC057486 TaxID=3346145 RepID=UPI0036B29EC6
MHWYIDVLKKYAVFSGRARRTEYWVFNLFNLAISIVLFAVGRAIDFTPLQVLYALAMLLPSLAVGVRRLHDDGRSGLWLLIGLIPLVGDIVLLYFFSSNSQPGDNKYGSVPKYIGAHI